MESTITAILDDCAKDLGLASLTGVAALALAWDPAAALTGTARVNLSDLDVPLTTDEHERSHFEETQRRSATSAASALARAGVVALRPYKQDLQLLKKVAG